MNSFKKHKKREDGYLLIESLVALSVCLGIMTSAAIILNRHSEIATENRNRALITFAIQEDINTIKHMTRYWNWQNSYYRPGVDMSNEMIYSINSDCNFSNGSFDKISASLMSDLGQYKFIINPEIDISKNGPITKIVPGFIITRKYQYLTYGSPPTQSSVYTGTLRVTYSVKKVNKNGSLVDYPYDSTVDIIIPAQFSC